MSELGQEELKEMYSEGCDCFDSGNYIKAEALLKDVLRHNPNLADVHNKLGVIANLAGKLKDASEHFERAVLLNPRYTEAALNLAITYNEMGQSDKAALLFDNMSRAAAERTGKLDPFAAGKIANEHFKLGKIYLEFSMPEEAIEEFHKALKLRGDLPDVLTRLGVCMRDKGDLGQAVTYLKRAKDANPGFYSALVQLGLTYHLMGKDKEAFEEWEDALDRNPNAREARSFLNIFKKDDKH